MHVGAERKGCRKRSAPTAPRTSTWLVGDDASAGPLAGVFGVAYLRRRYLRMNLIRMRHMRRTPYYISAAAILLAVGCDSATEPDPQVEGKTITVDASTNYAFIRLGSEAQVATPAVPSTST